MNLASLLTTVLWAALLSATTARATSPTWVLSGAKISCDTACGSPCSTASKQSMIDINTAARLNYAMGVAGGSCSQVLNVAGSASAPNSFYGICLFATANTATFSCTAAFDSERRLCCCNQAGCEFVAPVTCNSEQFKNTAGSCVSLTVCTLDTSFETVAPTATSDRVCGGTVTSCTANTHYQSQAATLTSNRVCSPVLTCTLDTSFQTVAPTATSNRVCGGTVTSCTENTQYQSQAATLTSNRVCSTLTVCGAGESQTTPPTTTSDRGCTKISSVPLHGWMLATAGQSCASICSVAAVSCTGSTDCTSEAAAEACFEDSLYALTTKAEIKSISKMIGGHIPSCTRKSIFANLVANQALGCDEATVAPALCCCKQAGCPAFPE